MASNFEALPSSCVVDSSRLTALLGPFTKKFLMKDDYLEDQCSKESIGARQIFPLLKHPNWRTPTIKHHCSRTELAACRRACSNKVGPDAAIQREFEQWFRKNIIPEFMRHLDQEELVVDLEKWIKEAGYPTSYADKIRRANNTEVWGEPYRYEAFAKIEQQFTTTIHEEKDTPANNVKERQICGPSDVKKLFANPFIHLLEGVAHRHIPQYCGRKNWLEICKTLEGWDILNPLFGAADGSGFDMTQLKWVNVLMNELIIAASKHPNVTWREPLNIDDLARVLMESEILRVMVDGVYYEVEGRASGDGWTTFGNTMLMIAYWRFVMDKLNIPYKLLVKGDDVLVCFPMKYRTEFESHWPKYFTKTKDQQNHGLGQICTEVKLGCITELDFLSNHFFRDSFGFLRMSRIPARVIQTLSWSTKVTHLDGLEARRELCYSKGMCLLAWARGLPIFETLGRKMVELGKPGKRTEYDKYADGGRHWYDVDDRTAYMKYLESWYGITESDVKVAESQIQALTSLTGEIHIPCFERFYWPLL